MILVLYFFFTELAEDRFKDYKEYYMEVNEAFSELAEKLLRKADDIILRYVSENDLPMPLCYVNSNERRL